MGTLDEISPSSSPLSVWQYSGSHRAGLVLGDALPNPPVPLTLTVISVLVPSREDSSLSTHLPPATRPVAILEDARELRASLLSLSQSSQPFSTPAAASNSRERHRFPGKWESETRHTQLSWQVTL